MENGDAIIHVLFGAESLPEKCLVEETPLLQQAFGQLQEYFAGKRKMFDLPYHLSGTLFQMDVRNALQTIPFGETRSYAEIALQIGHPKACRAVGMTNKINPLPLFFPCHRVIGSNKKLVGYAGGLHIKERLLNHEQAHA